MKEDYQKALKKSALFFLLSPVSLNGQRYQNKRSLELVTSHSSGYKTSSKKIHVLVPYYLTKFDDVMSSSFWVIPKTTSANLCKPIYGINYSTSICPFESGKCEKERKKIQKCEYLEIEKSFLDEIKNIFCSFWSAIMKKK